MFHKIHLPQYITTKHIKLICALAFIAAVALAFLGPSSRPVRAQQTEGPEGGTGAPGEETCEICHNSFPLNSGVGQVSIAAPETYQPGQTYQITVTSSSSDPNVKIWGFLLTTLNGENQPAGNLVSTSTNTLFETGVGSFPNRQYIRFANGFPDVIGTVSWVFDWTAPATADGPITFYSSFIDGNFDGTDLGDYIYTSTATSQAPAATPPPPPPPPVPVILNAAVDGKNLDLMVQNCDSSSVIIVNGVDQDTIFDPNQPSILVGQKTVKKMKIKVGKTVTLDVKNNDTGQESAPFTFTRPK